MDDLKIYAIADLHLEFEPILFESNDYIGGVLLLGGDVAECRNLPRNKYFFDNVVPRFDKVYAIKGNHDCYGEVLSEVDDKLQSFYDSVGVVYLKRNHDTIHLDDNTVLIASCLWTDFNNRDPRVEYYTSGFLADYECIRVNHHTQITTNDIYKEYLKDVTFITSALNEHHDKHCVVLTHHAPSMHSRNERYQPSFADYAFCCTGLDGLLSHHKNLTWVHGHTHHNVDYAVSDTVNVFANAKGYPNENEPMTFEQMIKRVPLAFGD